MQANITKQIERHLDEQLGPLTRILPWRRELADHLEEAFAVARADESLPADEASAWQQALENFGDLQQVATQLRKQHWPQYFGWRLVVIVAALLVVLSIVNFGALFDLPSLGFAVCPLLGFLLVNTLRGSTRWASANQVGSWGCASGAVIGLLMILVDSSNPSMLGAGMAMSLLSGLYCVLLFMPSRRLVLVLLSIALVELVIVIFSMHRASLAAGHNLAMQLYLPRNWTVDAGYLMQTLAILLAGVSLGIARFGFHGIARHGFSVGAGIFVVSLVKMLGDMSDPSKILGQVLVALGAMVVAIALSHLASDSSRLLRRCVR